MDVDKFVKKEKLLTETNLKIYQEISYKSRVEKDN
jgi:hypothetical protein